MLVDKNAVAEAKNLGIPVIGVADSNTDPSHADYVIPANDDALKALQLYADLFVAAVREGQGGEKQAKGGEK